MKPANYVIKVFGGVRALSRCIDRNASSISRWQKPKSGGGCDGYIPRQAQVLILKYALKHKLDITLEDLYQGRSVAKKRTRDKAV